MEIEKENTHATTYIPACTILNHHFLCATQLHTRMGLSQTPVGKLTFSFTGKENVNYASSHTHVLLQ